MNIYDVNSPAYIIDLDRLTKNLTILKRIQDESKAKILLATKAYSCFATFPLISEYLAGCTASSLHELMLAHEHFKKENHIFSPGYKEEELNQIAPIATTMIFNSRSQKNRFIDKARQINPKLKFGLRVNPELSQVKAAIYNPCAPFSRLGIKRTDLIPQDYDGISGLLCHALCGNQFPELKNMLGALEEKFGDVLHKMDWLDVGGGHLLTSPSYDVDGLIETLKTFQEKYNIQVILEPGEAVVANSGYLVAEVQDVLCNEKQIVIMDTSATTHMPDVMEMPYQPDIKGAQKGYLNDETAYRLGSATCLSGDFIGEYTFEKPLKIGDRVQFLDMAQYTMVKTTTFNGMKLPDIYLYSEKDGFKHVKSFGYQHFKERLG